MLPISDVSTVEDRDDADENNTVLASGDCFSDPDEQEEKETSANERTIEALRMQLQNTTSEIAAFKPIIIFRIFRIESFSLLHNYPEVQWGRTISIASIVGC